MDPVNHSIQDVHTGAWHGARSSVWQRVPHYSAASSPVGIMLIGLHVVPPSTTMMWPVIQDPAVQYVCDGSMAIGDVSGSGGADADSEGRRCAVHHEATQVTDNSTYLPGWPGTRPHRPCQQHCRGDPSGCPDESSPRLHGGANLAMGHSYCALRCCVYWPRSHSTAYPIIDYTSTHCLTSVAQQPFAHAAGNEPRRDSVASDVRRKLR